MVVFAASTAVATGGSVATSTDEILFVFGEVRGENIDVTGLLFGVDLGDDLVMVVADALGGDE